jgi:hypothetical protein
MHFMRGTTEGGIREGTQYTFLGEENTKENASQPYLKAMTNQ